MNSFSKKIFICLLLILATNAWSKGIQATFKGIVVDENGSPLPFANIVVKELNSGTVSMKNGEFKLRVYPGTYTIQITYIGYKRITEKLKFSAKDEITRKYTLESTAIEIGGITVIADEEFIPLEAETKSKINSGEIEHIQASSLNDVMELTPGVETSNPTLNSPEKATIRGGDPLGTQVILDGIPISNNANMQIGIGSSTANSGTDLRAIPAENAKEVEIIRGIPSAQYGDLVDGIMLVKTKASADPFRMKFKYNPHLYEANTSGGIAWNNWVFNGNLNIALSEHDIRVEGDGYTRIAAQLSANHETNLSEFKQILYFTRAYDESKEKPGYALREAWYNRDVNLKYTTNYWLKPDDKSKLSAKFSASFTRQNSYKQQLISRDNIVISDRVTEGTEEGRIVFGSYLGKNGSKETSGICFPISITNACLKRAR